MFLRASLSARLLLFALALGCRAELASGLAEGSADEVVLALDEAGIGAEKVRDDRAGEVRFAIRVAEAELVPAMAALRERGLPRAPAAGMESLLDEGGLIPSAGHERARLAAAAASELARSLEEMAGVERARVHLALPDPGTRLLDDAPTGPRASVLLSGEADASVDEAVRSLVAGAVLDLATDDITVVHSGIRPHPARDPVLAQVGPIAVSRGSAGLLKAILAAGLGLNVLLAGALVWSRRRVSKAAPEG